MVIFQKSLQDLVKGIRSQKKDVSPYISKVIVEIKTELRSTDQFTKAEAVGGRVCMCCVYILYTVYMSLYSATVSAIALTPALHSTPSPHLFYISLCLCTQRQP
jgi:hypothetical protein